MQWCSYDVHMMFTWCSHDVHVFLVIVSYVFFFFRRVIRVVQEKMYRTFPQLIGKPCFSVQVSPWKEVSNDLVLTQTIAGFCLVISKLTWKKCVQLLRETDYLISQFERSDRIWKFCMSQGWDPNLVLQKPMWVSGFALTWQKSTSQFIVLPFAGFSGSKLWQLHCAGRWNQPGTATWPQPTSLCYGNALTRCKTLPGEGNGRWFSVGGLSYFTMEVMLHLMQLLIQDRIQLWLYLTSIYIQYTYIYIYTYTWWLIPRIR